MTLCNLLWGVDNTTSSARASVLFYTHNKIYLVCTLLGKNKMSIEQGSQLPACVPKVACGDTFCDMQTISEIVTRRFSNHESRLLLQSHTFAISVISDLTHTKPWTKGHWHLHDLWPQVCWGHMCDTTQRSLCPSPMKIHQSMWIQWPFFQTLEPKIIDP